MLGILNDVQIEEVLRSQLVGRIGCHSGQNIYVVPISYAYDGNYIYAHTFEGMKINIMRSNPHVCFEVDSLKDLSEWKSVIAWGEFQELTEETERINGLKILMERNLPILSSSTMHISPHWPFPPKEISKIEGIVFRIRLKEKSGRFESNQASPHFAG
ncbi:MAG TPA: pyridoxamine 5'-phosphate oxidase family protein [Chitinophagaceae bacterium]|nr:pyridoxamine 5'-phosphate oxidase family protein [Chitinophagaceae bacterium]